MKKLIILLLSAAGALALFFSAQSSSLDSDSSRPETRPLVATGSIVCAPLAETELGPSAAELAAAEAQWQAHKQDFIQRLQAQGASLPTAEDWAAIDAFFSQLSGEWSARDRHRASLQAGEISYELTVSESDRATSWLTIRGAETAFQCDLRLPEAILAQLGGAG